MPQRPPILGRGVVRAVRQPDLLYEIEMPNGHLALAVVPKEGPRLPAGIEPIGIALLGAFSPFEMNRCRIVSWELS
ncbi:MAG: hypothetical protein KDM64_16550 [Verrucomicrobiae bacterium]|nr:hypothetical protein [Verrucomicrobiae bacterium]